jgi:hypothetical protein
MIGRPPATLRATVLACVVLAITSAGTMPALPAEWGAVVPGQSTQESVRRVHGAPSRTIAQTIEGYQASQWVYEGAQAPLAARRMVVDFGLLLPAGYRPEIVRSLRLEPKPGAFNKRSILGGWGVPTSTGREGETRVFFYRQGLLVYFDRDGEDVELLVFTPPQPEPGEAAGPGRPPAR